MSTTWAILLLSLFSAVLVVLAGWLLIGKRRSPEERERIRRQHLSVRGRIVDADITDIDGDVLSYSYQIAGVIYHATQDVSAFRHMLPQDATLLLGPAHVKYSTQNPANSILIGEHWSGLRLTRQPRQQGA